MTPLIWLVTISLPSHVASAVVGGVGFYPYYYRHTEGLIHAFRLWPSSEPAGGGRGWQSLRDLKLVGAEAPADGPQLRMVRRGFGSAGHKLPRALPAPATQPSVNRAKTVNTPPPRVLQFG